MSISAELKTLKLHDMASAYAELRAQGAVSIGASEWLIEHLLEVESTDIAMHSRHFQLRSAEFRIGRDLVNFECGQA